MCVNMDGLVLGFQPSLREREGVMCSWYEAIIFAHSDYVVAVSQRVSRELCHILSAINVASAFL